MTIVVDNVISSYCPVCCIKTAETICPLCKRKLWQCGYCGQKTFGTYEDESECGHCGKKNYHSDVQPKVEA